MECNVKKFGNPLELKKIKSEVQGSCYVVRVMARQSSEFWRDTWRSQVMVSPSYTLLFHPGRLLGLVAADQSATV